LALNVGVTTLRVAFVKVVFAAGVVAGCFQEPLGITVRSVAGEPYERIIGYELGPVPEPALVNPYELDPDSIPF